jgi:hypothetical protein
MRPLNRPMFKMGGPVKEGIMDGIKEPETIGGGTIVGEDKGEGRTGFQNPLFLAGGAILSRLAPFFTRQGVKSFGAGLATKPSTFQPATTGIMSKLPQFIQRNLPTGRFRQTTNVPGQGNVLTEAQIKAGMIGTPGKLSRTQALLDPKRLGMAIRENPFTALSTPTLAFETARIGGPLALDAAKGFANFIVPGERFDPFKPEKPEEIVKKSNVGQVGKKGEDTKVEKTGTDANQFDDDGTKKDTSVERLLKGVVTRAKRDAAADTAIKFGQQLRTGQASIKDPSSVIDVASQEFDKVSDIQSKVDLARIENELKKQQIKEQALATDKYIAASKATGKPVDFVARKTLGIPTSISETTAIFEKAQPGFTKTNEGTQIVAKEWADTEGINYQGSLGGDDDLKKANKIEEFKLNPESFILEKIEELDGNNGLYVFGTNVFEYNNGVVKKIKN